MQVEDFCPAELSTSDCEHERSGHRGGLGGGGSYGWGKQLGVDEEEGMGFLSDEKWKKNPQGATSEWDDLIAGVAGRVARSAMPDRRYAAGLKLGHECEGRDTLTGAIYLYRVYDLVDQYGEDIKNFVGGVKEHNAIVAGTATSHNATWDGSRVEDGISSGRQQRYDYYQTFIAFGASIGSLGTLPLWVGEGDLRYGVLAVETTMNSVKINGTIRTTGTIDPNCPKRF